MGTHTWRNISGTDIWERAYSWRDARETGEWLTGTARAITSIFQIDPMLIHLKEKWKWIFGRSCTSWRLLIFKMFSRNQQCPTLSRLITHLNQKEKSKKERLLQSLMIHTLKTTFSQTIQIRCENQITH